METFDNELTLHNHPHLIQNEGKEFEVMAEIIEVQQEEEHFAMDWYDPTCYATEILGAKYELVEVDEVINQLNHLNLEQKKGPQEGFKGAHCTI
jgi:hypothetical protein